MALELYHFAPSPPCRMVRLLAAHLDLDMDLKDVDLSKGEQLDPDYIKINPQHTIPTLIDDGFILTESRAILMYLANKYGEKDEALYPTEPEKRAVIDMRFCFDLSSLYVKFSEAYFPVMFNKVPLDSEKVDKLNEALGHVENFLKDGFIAGSELTIADFSFAVVLSTLEACGHDLSDFPEIVGYLEKCAELMKGWEEVNMTGATIFGAWFKAALTDAEG